MRRKKEISKPDNKQNKFGDKKRKEKRESHL
jgi:hypothetical protein